ncbi:MAG: hypothetical protein AB1489_07420 [Acidobacteriota bacterium]
MNKRFTTLSILLLVFLWIWAGNYTAILAKEKDDICKPEKLQWGPLAHGLQFSAWWCDKDATIYCLIRNGTNYDLEYCNYFIGYFESVRLQVQDPESGKWITLKRMEWPGGRAYKGVGPSKHNIHLLLAGQKLSTGREGKNHEYTYYEILGDFQWPANLPATVTCRISQGMCAAKRGEKWYRLESSPFIVNLPSSFLIGVEQDSINKIFNSIPSNQTIAHSSKAMGTR